jgi:multicomponent Na+:H+ antiporter subunit E
MRPFLWNILLALTWAVATGLFTVSNFAAGFVLGYLVLWFSHRGDPAARYVARVPQLARFATFYIWELIKANIRVAYDVVTPTNYMQPGVVAVPLEVDTDAEIALLANLITLTPGTLSLDLSPDHGTLYVHIMYIDDRDIERARRHIKETLERRVLEVMR